MFIYGSKSCGFKTEQMVLWLFGWWDSKWWYVFLVTYFVLSNKDRIYEVVDIKENGRPVNPPEYLVSLLIFGALRHINGTDELVEMAKFHQKFRYACGDLQPSGRVLRKFM